MLTNRSLTLHDDDIAVTVYGSKSSMAKGLLLGLVIDFSCSDIIFIRDPNLFYELSSYVVCIYNLNMMYIHEVYMVLLLSVSG